MSGRVIPLIRTDHADKDFDERPRFRLSWPAFLVLLALLAGATNFVSLGIGLQQGIEIGGQREKREAAERPRRVQPAPAAAETRWSCTKEELAEIRRACAARARIGAIR